MVHRGGVMYDIGNAAGKYASLPNRLGINADTFSHK